MAKAFKNIIALVTGCFTLFIISSCTKADSTTLVSELPSNTPTTNVAGTDKDLYDLSKVTTGFTWYKKSDALLNRSSGSGHVQPLLRTRYNSIASTQLDANGKILAGAKFAEGSLIVKELTDSPATLARYAVLFKKPGSVNADANGWVWGYINADGVVAIAAGQKGAACISCHSQSGNIDYMLMNKFFP